MTTVTSPNIADFVRLVDLNARTTAVGLVVVGLLVLLLCEHELLRVAGVEGSRLRVLSAYAVPLVGVLAAIVVARFVGLR